MRYRFVLVMVAVLLGGGFSFAPARGAPPPPSFEGKSIPVPPKQGAKWRPPRSKLPADFVAATRRLFVQGLADPRGCAYSEIEVVTGNCKSGLAGVTRTHGWVLPAKRGVKQRFAVCWNGLTYPLVSVGKRVNLAKDVNALVKEDVARLKENRKKHKQREEERKIKARLRGEVFHPRREPKRRSYSRREQVRRSFQLSETRTISHQEIFPLKAVMLLRLGRVGLAERLWNQWKAGDDRYPGKDLHLALAREWIRSLFDRAVCAHARGDDRLALLSARALVPIWNKVESDAFRRGIPYRFSNKKPDEKQVHFPWLDPVHSLIADQERRLREKNQDAPGQPGSTGRLVHDLQDISMQAKSFPGGRWFQSDPGVRALVKLGEAAVEPLIECYANDNRLTRSVLFGRDSSLADSITEVNLVALVALREIFQRRSFTSLLSEEEKKLTGKERRRALAEKLRAFSKQNRGANLTERWYRTLADDKAGAKAWLEAARDIVCPTNVRYGLPSDTSFATRPEGLTTGEKPGMRGESLRDKKDPGVSNLMLRRIAELLDHKASTSTGEPNGLLDAAVLAGYLADWDLHQARQVLPKLVAGCIKALEEMERACNLECTRMVEQVTRLTLQRAKAKDSRALADYAEWLLARPGLRLVVEMAPELLKPMSLYPQHPAVARAAKWMFEDQASPWNPFLQVDRRGGRHRTLDMIKSPLLGVEPFRRQIIGQLGDRTVAGHIEVASNGRIEIKGKGGWGTITSTYADDPDCPAPGSRQEFRVGDLLAHELSGLEGTPRCELFWPKAKRDLALAKLTKFLEQYGARFWSREGVDESWNQFRIPEANLSFPSLDGPASRIDMALGLAIFSLQYKGRARSWNLPGRPLEAKWTARKDDYWTKQVKDPSTGGWVNEIRYYQGGLVWQAEELKVGKEWRRFYGMVGKYFVAKVPAGEIEFPADKHRWARLDNGLDCQVQPPGRLEKDGLVQLTRLGPDSPLEARVMLRNRSGLDIGLPRRISGIEVELSRAQKRSAQPRGWNQESKWEVLEKKPYQPPPRKTARTLTPTEDFEVFRIDLRELFGAIEPGEYLVEVGFRAGESGVAAGHSNPVRFAIHER